MKPFHIEQLIAKELLGEKLSDEERRQLDVWLKASAAHRKQYAHIRQSHFSSTRYATYRQIDAGKAYRQFLYKTHRTSRMKSYVRMAAACLIPLLLITGTIWLNHYRKEPVGQSAAIVPGSTRAVLQMADGDSIVLDGKTLTQTAPPLADKAIQTSARGITLPPANRQMTTSTDTPSSQNVLRTTENGEFLITLEDGTTVHLNYNTTLRYPEHFSARERLVYLEGEAYFEVAKDARRPFKVMTRDVTIREYGTSFNVNTYSEELIEVVLVEGSIGILDGKKEHPLHPGERIRLNHMTEEINIDTVDVNMFIAWHEGRFIFDNRRLDDIMETLSHWYGVEVVFDKPELRGLHFTGNMDRYGNLTPILKAISQTVGLRITIKNRTIHINQ